MKRRKVLLVGWDAADWKVIRPLTETGGMPTIRSLVEAGTAGQIATLHPPLSPMLWTSIATGKRPFKHGILGFAEPTPDGCGVQPVSNLSRKTKALWNILSQNDLRSVVIGWWPSHPAEHINGVMVSDHYHRAHLPLDKGWQLPAGAVHPAELAATLAALRIHPDQLTPEMVEPFIPLAREIDQDRDGRLAVCLRTLAECMSIHSAAMWLLDHQPWDFFAVYHDAIDHFCHAFMRYHPPRQASITERDFELYHNVVSMAYRLHDQMLGALMEKAGPDTTVILMSDHGFHPDHLRPSSIPDIPAGPAIEHRDLGVLAINGPGIAKGGVWYGASVLDVAPTVLALYGLPVGEDMDGKVLSSVFAETPALAFIPSWDSVPGADGRHPAYTLLDPVAAHEVLEQMIALGYIERPDEDRRVAVEKTIRELRYNLGEAYQDGDRHAEAYEIFAKLYRAEPDEQLLAVRLFVSCQALGMRREMRRIVDDLDGRRRALFEEALKKIAESKPDPLFSEDQRRELARWRNLARFQPPLVDYLKAQLLRTEKRHAEALAALERVAEGDLLRPAVFLESADLYLRLRRWRDAQQVYEKALVIDPDSAHAHLGLCRLALRRRKFRDAAQSALEALQRLPHLPLAHYLLGRALAGMREYARAAAAFRAAISINPNSADAHARLAALLEKHLGDAESAREHRVLARRMQSRERPAAVARHTSESLLTREAQAACTTGEMPPLAETLIVVTGLPRSGTSTLMQMLAAGGMRILSDGLREADEANPRGYLEFEPVKRLLSDAVWLREARGTAVKIVAPLLAALPPGLPCRVILSERDLDEVLDSQERMRALRNEPASTPDRRSMLKDEYSRELRLVKTMLAARPCTRLVVIGYRLAVTDPLATARKLNDFLDGGLDVAKMAAAVEPLLYRNRAERA